MDSALSPREIQARIRSGESLEDVASAAGVPQERIEPFAAPVLAERAHVAGSAQAAPVRRVGEPSTNHQPLRTVVAERCAEWGIDPDDVEWDAWKVENRKWLVQASFERDGEHVDAEFRYDQMGRFSVARNDIAKDLIGERTAPPPAAPRDPDAEPTLDYSDEFALVRAVGAEAAQASDAADPVEDEPRELTITEIRQLHITEGELSLPATELRQVDGVYDLVPESGGLDMIYDLLGGYAEEGAPYDFEQVPPAEGEAAAVVVDVDDEAQEATAGEPADENPWSRLSRRQRQKLRREQAAQERAARERAAEPAADAEPQTDPTPEAEDEPDVVAEATQAESSEAAVVAGTVAAGDAADLEEVELTSAELEPHSPATATELSDVDALDDIAVTPADEDASPDTAQPDEAESDEPATPQLTAQPADPEAEPQPEAEPEPRATAAAPVADAAPTPTEPTQDALLDGPAPAKPAARKKKRASVPSWDEIMFGGPKPSK